MEGFFSSVGVGAAVSSPRERTMSAGLGYPKVIVCSFGDIPRGEWRAGGGTLYWSYLLFFEMQSVRNLVWFRMPSFTAAEPAP